MRFTDTQILDWIEKHPAHAPQQVGGGRWIVTAYVGRETWGRAETMREAVIQAMTGTGPEVSDAAVREEPK